LPAFSIEVTTRFSQSDLLTEYATPELEKIKIPKTMVNITLIKFSFKIYLSLLLTASEK